MTSVPPTQPPAAPETDVRLTEAERDSLRVVLARWFKSENRVDAMMQRHVIPAVERIVAERVRVVEGERDAAVEQAEWWERTCTYWNEQATEAQRFRDMNAARAESAEAAHAALVAGVEALADEWEADFMAYRHEDPAHLRIRALLAGGEER